MKCNFCNSSGSESSLITPHIVNICESCIVEAQHSFSNKQAYNLPRGKSCSLCRDILPIPIPGFTKRLFCKGKFSVCEQCAEVCSKFLHDQELSGKTIQFPKRLQRIHVLLLDEGTEVWRPVNALYEGENIFKIMSVNEKSDDEIWEFNYGDLVHCEEKMFSSGEIGLVAKSLAANK